MTVKTQQFYYNLLLQDYVFRLLRVIIRPSNEPTQDYLIPSAQGLTLQHSASDHRVHKSVLYGAQNRDYFPMRLVSITKMMCVYCAVIPVKFGRKGVHTLL